MQSCFRFKTIGLASLVLGLMLISGLANAATCAFVCRTPGALNTMWEQPEYDRLVSLGFTITLVQDNGAYNGQTAFSGWTQAQMEAYDLIFYDYSASSGNVDKAPAGLCVKPMVIQKFLGLGTATAGANYVGIITNNSTTAGAIGDVHDSTNLNSSNFVVANLTGNPILTAAGLTPGATIAYTTTGGKTAQSIDLHTATTGICAGATVLATVPSDGTFPGTAMVWTVDQGATTWAGTAAGKRAGFGFFASAGPYTAADLTPDGWKLFDATINWMVGASPSPTPTPTPTATATPTPTATPYLSAPAGRVHFPDVHTVVVGGGSIGTVTPSVTTVTLRNTGTATLNFTGSGSNPGLAIGGTAASMISFTGTTPATLAAGATLKVVLQYNPPPGHPEGTFDTATLTITSNASNSPSTVNLVGLSVPVGISRVKVE